MQPKCGCWVQGTKDEVQEGQRGVWMQHIESGDKECRVGIAMTRMTVVGRGMEGGCITQAMGGGWEKWGRMFVYCAVHVCVTLCIVVNRCEQLCVIMCFCAPFCDAVCHCLSL